MIHQADRLNRQTTPLARPTRQIVSTDKPRRWHDPPGRSSQPTNHAAGTTHQADRLNRQKDHWHDAPGRSTQPTNQTTGTTHQADQLNRQTRPLARPTRPINSTDKPDHWHDPPGQSTQPTNQTTGTTDQADHLNRQTMPLARPTRPIFSLVGTDQTGPNGHGPPNTAHQAWSTGASHPIRTHQPWA